MMRRNIANDRLKNLKKTLTSEAQNSTAKHMLHEKTTSSARNSVNLSTREKRKVSSDSEDAVSKRVKLTSPDLSSNCTTSKLCIAEESNLKHANPHSTYENYKKSRAECSELMFNPNYQSNKSVQSFAFSSNQTMRNIANERLARVRNNIHSEIKNGPSVHHSAKNTQCFTPLATRKGNLVCENEKFVSPLSYDQSVISPRYQSINSSANNLHGTVSPEKTYKSRHRINWKHQTSSNVASILGDRGGSFKREECSSSNISQQSLATKGSENNISKECDDGRCSKYLHDKVDEMDIEIIASTGEESEDKRVSLCTDNFCEKSEDICLVVDTNILLHNLKIIKDIVNMPITGSIKPLIHIPWMVLQELDFLKDDSLSGRNAQRAIVYINSLLKAENCRIKGQNVFEANEQLALGKSPDDKIISCCLQFSEKFKTVILVSNDTNVKNKALIHGIGACSHNEVLIKLHGLLKKNKKFQKILHKMNVVCSYAISECAKDAYGDVWKKMDLLKDRPWSMLDCLKIFKKYYVAVFADKLLKQFQIAVNDAMDILEHKLCLADDTDDFKNFADVSGAICFFLKDIDSLKTMMQKTIKEIKDIKNS